MITVKIADDERSIDDADPQWINQQINMRRNAGQNVCVRVIIRDGDVDMVLATATCGTSGGGGGRPPRPKESKIFDLWDKRGLKNSEFTGGELVAFLQQLARLL